MFRFIKYFITRPVYLDVAFRAEERAKAIRQETAHINPENELLLAEHNGAADILEGFAEDLRMWAEK